MAKQIFKKSNMGKSKQILRFKYWTSSYSRIALAA